MSTTRDGTADDGPLASLNLPMFNAKQSLRTELGRAVWGLCDPGP